MPTEGGSLPTEGGEGGLTQQETDRHGMAIGRPYYLAVSLLACSFCLQTHYASWPDKGYSPKKVRLSHNSLTL